MVEVHGFLHHFLHLNQASVVVVGVLDHHIVGVTNRVILNQVPAQVLVLTQALDQAQGNLALVLALNHSLVDHLKNLQSRINQSQNQFL